jgi:DNA polymerase-3 subunit beta
MTDTDNSLRSGIKISCLREQLVETVSMVSRAVSSRSSVQVLAGILVTAEKGELRLAATDMELSITSSLEAEVESEGASVVPGRVFVDACRSLPSGEEKVVLEQVGGARMLELGCGAASYRLNVAAPDDFPRLPETKHDVVFKVARDPFLEAATRVSRAASRDESRPVLTGILVSFEIDEGSEGVKLTMAATDSYRMAVRETILETKAPELESIIRRLPTKETKAETEPPKLEAILPARAIAELARIPSADVELELAIEENHAAFFAGKTTLTTRRIDGQFPKYWQLRPASFTYTVKLPKSEFLDVVRRVAVMAQRTSPIRLHFKDGALTVSAQTQDVGEASETLPVAFSGEPFEIGFNAEFLREGVELVIGDEVELNLISPVEKTLLQAEGDGFWYLMAPIRLAG